MKAALYALIMGVFVFVGCGKAPQSTTPFAFCRSVEGTRPYIDMYSTQENKVVVRYYDDSTILPEFVISNVTSANNEPVTETLVEAIRGSIQPKDHNNVPRIKLSAKDINGISLELNIGNQVVLTMNSTESTEMSCTLIN